MTDPTFNEAYETICHKCGEKAGLHRLTRTGRTYCLVFGKDAPLYMTTRVQHDPYYTEVVLYQTPVKNLQKSALPIEVGAVLDYNLNSIVAAGGSI